MKIIKIGAVWCPACLLMHKVWSKLKEEFPDLEIINYDIDMDEGIETKYNVGKTLPVIIFLTEKDAELDRLVGEKSYDEIKAKLLEVYK